MSTTLINLKRGGGFDSSAINLPNPGDLIYDEPNLGWGGVEPPEIWRNDCEPWVNTETNYLFVGNVCINPTPLGVPPLAIEGPFLREINGMNYVVNDFVLNYNQNHFMTTNGLLTIKLGNGLYADSNGINVAGAFTHNVASNTQLGEVKTSWDGSTSLVTDSSNITIDTLYGGKSTGISNYSLLNSLYPVLSTQSSTLYSYKYGPNNLFETISGKNNNGRLYTVIRPASSDLAGCIKVSSPLGKVQAGSTSQFPGPSSLYRWLNDDTSIASNCNSSVTYLARLTNRFDLLAYCGVDIDNLMGQYQYVNPTYAMRDTLFETFVPLPLPTHLHPGIAKLSYTGSELSNAPDFIPSNSPKTYPVGINTTQQLVTLGPERLSDLTNDLTLEDLTDVGHGTTPKPGEVLMYSDKEWVNTQPSSVREYLIESPKLIDSSDSTFDVCFDENNFFQNFYITDNSLANGIRIFLPDHGGEYYIVIDGHSLTTTKSVALKGVFISRSPVQKVLFGNSFALDNNHIASFSVLAEKVTLLKIKSCKPVKDGLAYEFVFITAEEYFEIP